MTDPTTMTLDQIRDWAARRQGWTLEEYGTGRIWYPKGWPDCDTPVQAEEYHPIPPTLDAIAGLMPSGWDWAKANGWFTAHRLGKPEGGTNNCRVRNTGNELLDRARLAMLATLAEDRNKEKA